MTSKMTTTQNVNPANHLTFPVGLHLRQHLSQNPNLSPKQVAPKGAQKVTFILK
jgi:hypothetical protein